MASPASPKSPTTPPPTPSTPYRRLNEDDTPIEILCHICAVKILGTAFAEFHTTIANEKPKIMCSLECFKKYTGINKKRLSHHVRNPTPFISHIKFDAIDKTIDKETK